MYHLIAKDKAVKQYILPKYCNCNSFGDTNSYILNSKNFKVAISQLFNVQQV